MSQEARSAATTEAQAAELLRGKTISALYVHTDEIGAIDWIALDFTDGEQVEISAYGMHGMEAGLDVEAGTRIRDIYKVATS